jgi:hypothetical protein
MAVHQSVHNNTRYPSCSHAQLSGAPSPSVLVCCGRRPRRDKTGRSTNGSPAPVRDERTRRRPSVVVARSHARASGRGNPGCLASGRLGWFVFGYITVCFGLFTANRSHGKRTLSELRLLLEEDRAVLPALCVRRSRTAEKDTGWQKSKLPR